MDAIIRKDLDIIRDNLLEFKDKIRGSLFLVTGGAGFLGSWICDVLNSFDANIICVDNMISGSESNISHLYGQENFSIIKNDVSNLTISENVDYVIHMACIASPPMYQKHPIETLNANILGTKNMLDFAKRIKVKTFLFASTSEVYGDAKIIPTPESYCGNVNLFGPRSVYDEGKRAAELYCYSYHKQFHLPIRIARIFNTYGPRLDAKLNTQYGRVVTKFIYQALKHRPLTVYGDGTQTRSFCYITDQIEGLFKLMLVPELDGKVINIGNDEEITILELAKLILKLTNSKSEISFESLPENDPKRRKPKINKAKRSLRWKPKIDLKTGLHKTIEWIMSEN
ncbi:MAG: SDR family oxidoreductase [Candidatus Bathyarchaeota archaeon]|nr:MAG: SDR family oxidoreductase [Candidatus Bathyarchaeota archaeon]